MSRIHEGLERLGVRRMLLAIHDTSFPSDPDEDIGRGSPATRASERLFAYARGLGFTGIQLGPQGQTARSNPSPYDGTIFSRHLGNIGVRSLRKGGAFEGLVDEAEIDRLLVEGGGPARHHHAYDAIHRLVEVAHRSFLAGLRPDLAEPLRAFEMASSDWLLSDALYSALCEQHHGAGFRDWPEGDRDTPEARTEHREHMARYAFGQFLVHEELKAARERCGLLLYGDLQVGYADADAWRHRSAFLRGYLMGAPPSRTNPEGQPWGYPVLDPSQYTGAARALVVARAEKAFAEYDGLRIDHPHGLVCPWVYRDEGDPMLAVRGGARLFESPDLPDHPALARFAIARLEQIDRDAPRYADRWVRDLDDAQIGRYSILIDALLAAAEKHGRSRADLSCEVLSTLPAPLGAVLARHGLGRWRVTQKANMDDPTDVYRTENAEREDWVMLGNHDTAPILSVIRGWAASKREQWARHLTARLHLREPERLVDDRYLATAMLAELFASRAENVSIFFCDLFGYTERFNVPGLVADVNWTLRLPHDFERLPPALDMQLAIDLALAAQEHGTERR